MFASTGVVRVPLHNLLSGLREQVAVVVSAVLVGMLAAAALTWTTTPRYASSARLFVSVVGQPDADQAYEGNLFTQQRVASYAELLTGTALTQQVVDDLGLPSSAAELAAAVTAVPVPDTVVLDVQVSDTSPERAQQVAMALVSAFSDRVAQLETPPGNDSPVVTVSTIAPPDLQRTPITPGLSATLPRGAALGLVVGVLVALARARYDTSVRDPEDLQAAGLDLLCRLPEDPELRTAPVGDGGSPIAGALRALGVRLRPVDDEGGGHLVVVTSPLPGEGKTTLAVHLAASVARTGRRVALVDANLWRPRVHTALELPGGPGLTDVLGDVPSLTAALRPTGLDGLHVLPAGPMPPDPGDLLSSPPAGELWAALRAGHDLVVVDAPAVLAVSDAAVLAATADACLLVVRYGRTRAHELDEAVTALVGVRATLLGAVLTRAPRTALASPWGRRGYRPDPPRRPAVSPTAPGLLFSGDGSP